MPRNNYTPRISILSGIVVAGDALSETVIADLEAIDRLAARLRRNLDVRVFCADSTYADARLTVVADWRQVVADSHFRTSDIYIYHFGVYHVIHDTMAFARRDAQLAVYFHNVTPPQYLNDTAEELIMRSYQQIESFRSADRLLTASKYSADQLEQYGLGKPIEVAPLFGPNAPDYPESRAEYQPGQPVRLIYCGRFVPSKGIEVLLAAIAQMSSRIETPVELLLAGFNDYSDTAYLERLQSMAGMLPEGASASFEFNLPTEELRKRTANADALVLPSWHEGFGMPVIEALLSGLPVVCSRAGALPEVANGLALTFEPGDVVGLTACLDSVVAACRENHVACDMGEQPYSEWLRRVCEYGVIFSREAYVERTTVRFETWLDALSNQSGSFRDYLQLTGLQAFGSASSAAPLEAALAGYLSAEAVASVGVEDLDNALVRLLRWPFPGHQSESDLAYWRGVLNSEGQRGLLRRISGAHEMRQFASRRQAGPHIQASLAKPVPALSPSTKREDNRLSLEHPAVQLLLAGNQSTADFVREAYLLLLGREPEHGGLGWYFEILTNGTVARREVVSQIMESEEFRHRNKSR